MSRIISLFFLISIIYSFEANAMTVEEAYAAIPHQRTVFDANASKLSKAQIDDLKKLFFFSDRGTMLRVEAMRAYRGGDLSEFRRVVVDYRVLISSFKSISAAAELKRVHELVLEAIQDHQRFFESRLQENDGLGKRSLVFTPDVQQASQKLHQAYNRLMQIFPNEPSINKKAFFDYLCALDFL